MDITVVGAGTMGLSWIGLFLARNLKVTVYDTRPDVRIAVLGGLEKIKWSLASLGYPTDKFMRRLFFEERLYKAVAGADYIQECIPDVVSEKQSLYEKLDRFTRPSTLILSSSASLCATLITAAAVSVWRRKLEYTPA